MFYRFLLLHCLLLWLFYCSAHCGDPGGDPCQFQGSLGVAGHRLRCAAAGASGQWCHCAGMADLCGDPGRRRLADPAAQRGGSGEGQGAGANRLVLPMRKNEFQLCDHLPVRHAKEPDPLALPLWQAECRTDHDLPVRSA